MRKIQIFLFVFICTFFAFAQETQQTTVIKEMTGNPTIGLAKFMGTAEHRAVFEEAIRLCGWFRMTGAKDALSADIILQAQVKAGQGGVNIQTMVQGNGKTFTTNQTAGDVRLASFQTMDAILKGLFNTRAFCSRKIFFAIANNSGMKEIYSCYFDGSAQERVTFNNAISTEPSFGDSSHLLYTLTKNNSQAVILMDLRMKRQKIISQAPGLNSSASLSHDGTKVALPMSTGNTVDLYLIDIQRNQKIRLTKDKNVESSPVFSPDGRQLCYVSDKNGVPQLHLMDLSNYRTTPLMKGYRESVSPDWSPVSNKICFSAKEDGRYVIKVMDMADPEHKVTIVTPAPGYWEAPSWAPDGRHIICTKSGSNGSRKDLYVVDSWLCVARQVSKGANLSLPAWQP